MFFSPGPNIIESDEGFSVEILDRDHIRYTEGPKTMRLYAEVLTGAAGWSLYPNSIRAWDPPYSEVKIDREEHDEIVEKIRQAFRFWGYEIKIAETGLEYQGPWPVELSADELAIQMKEKKEKALRDKKAGKKLLGAEIVELNTENFANEVLNSPIPALVYFWSHAGEAFNYLMSPILEEASIRWRGRIKICKMDYDEAEDVVIEYNIVSIPTLILFENGEPIKKIVGPWPEEAFVQEFKEWL